MQTNRDGSVTWTIPFQVTVNLGLPVIAPAASPAVDPTSQSGGSVPSRVDDRASTSTQPADLRDALSDLSEATQKPYYAESQDTADRNAYYAGIDQNANPGVLYSSLHDLLVGTHRSPLTYRPAKHVYTWVDLQPNLKLRSIYSGLEFDPEQIIREDFRIDEIRAERVRELLQRESSLAPDRFLEEMALLEASLPYNCEHVVPQSWFGKDEPMRGDLHHLFACESNCNSFRGNTPYFDFPDFDEAIRDDCGRREGNKFEPGAGKGAIARASLYFLIRYPGEINAISTEYDASRIQILLKWHQEHKVNRYEKHRNQAIAAKQGNRNPLIDFPQLASRIDFTKGLG